MFEPNKRACTHENPDRIYTLNSHLLTLKAHITIRSHAYAYAEIFEASSTNIVDPDLTAHTGAVRSGSTLFSSLLIRLRAKKGPAPPLGNFADISYLKENFKPHLLRDVCTLCSGALVSYSLLHMLL